MNTLQRAFLITCLTFLAPVSMAEDWVGFSLDGVACSGNGQGFGPWDFFTVDEPADPDWQAGRWWEARNIHAKPGLAALNSFPFDIHDYIRASGEFDYLLRAYPNHPHILGAVIQLEFRRKEASDPIPKWKTPPECYLQRAKAFRPQQPHIDLLMGYYLQKLGNTKEALSFYHQALALDSNYAEAYYNIALAYLELGDYTRASDNAKKAYELGFPLEGLRNKLERVGAWEPS